MCVMVAVGATWYGLTRPYFFLKGERLNGQKLSRSIVTIL